MAGREENLGKARSTSEAQKNGAKGGIASGKSRRQQKSLKALLNTLLEAKPSSEMLAQLKKNGFSEEECTNKAVYIASLFSNAIKGNAKAIEAITKLLGEDIETNTKIENLEAETRLKEAQRKEIENANEKGKEPQTIEFIFKDVSNNEDDNS